MKALMFVAMLGLLIGVSLNLPVNGETPDFKMTWTKPYETSFPVVEEGGCSQKQFDIDAINNFDGNVTLTTDDPYSSSPIHVSIGGEKSHIIHTAVLRVDTVHGQRADITIWVDNPGLIGTFNIRVNGTSGSITHSLSSTITVIKKPEPPAAKGFIPGFDGIALMGVLALIVLVERRTRQSEW